METVRLCASCRSALMEGAEFCQECGQKVEAESVIEDVFCPECGCKTTSEFKFCAECGAALDDARDIIPLPETGPGVGASLSYKRKMAPARIIIIAASVVAAIAVVAVFALGDILSPVGGSHFIYARDGELYFSYTGGEPFQLTDRLWESEPDYPDSLYPQLSNYTLLSDDKRYAFFPDRIEPGVGGQVTYYWRDLKKVNDKDDIPIKIDSEIMIMSVFAPHLTNDGSKLFYIKGEDGRFYVYDRASGDKIKIDDDVMQFHVNDTGDYVIYSTYVDEEVSIYEISLNGLEGESVRIDANSQIETALPNEKKVYYTKEDTLYLKDFGQEKVRISTDVSQVVSVTDSGTVYYTKADEIVSNLSSLIEDDMAESDQNLERPEGYSGDIYDYIGDKFESSSSRLSREDFIEEVWRDSAFGSDVNPDTGMRGYWTEEIDRDSYEATLIEHYADMMADFEAVYAYSAKERRDELRAALNDERNAVTYTRHDLYYWTAAGETLVASDLPVYSALAVSSKSPVAVYQKYAATGSLSMKLSDLAGSEDSGSGSTSSEPPVTVPKTSDDLARINLVMAAGDLEGFASPEDLVWTELNVSGKISELRDNVSFSREVSDEVYAAAQGVESQIECSDAIGWQIDRNGRIFFINDYDDEDNYGTLMSTAVSGSVMAAPAVIDEDVSLFRFGNENGNIYYFKDMNKEGTGELCVNGESIASDVYASSLYNYEGSDSLLYYIDYSTRNNDGTLCAYTNGEQARIYDGVSDYVAIDSTNIVFLTDYSEERHRGDIMLYSGADKPELVDSDVTALLWNPDMMAW